MNLSDEYPDIDSFVWRERHLRSILRNLEVRNKKLRCKPLILVCPIPQRHVLGHTATPPSTRR